MIWNTCTLHKMNSKEKLDLKKLVSDMDSQDNTPHIRKVKHSLLIRDSIRDFELLKQKESLLRCENPEAFKELAMNQCSFLFYDYTDIFNKLLKDEINLDIMSKLLETLKMIEDETVDQHEGSVIVGKILKELYLDSAIKRADNLDKEHAVHEKTVPVENKILSWKDFKALVHKTIVEDNTK